MLSPPAGLNSQAYTRSLSASTHFIENEYSARLNSQLSLDAIEGNFFLNIIFPTILEKNGNQKSSAIDFIFKPSDRFSLWTLA